MLGEGRHGNKSYDSEIRPLNSWSPYSLTATRVSQVDCIKRLPIYEIWHHSGPSLSGLRGCSEDWWHSMAYTVSVASGCSGATLGLPGIAAGDRVLRFHGVL